MFLKLFLNLFLNTYHTSIQAEEEVSISTTVLLERCICLSCLQTKVESTFI